ncbi:hypothetical protein N7450_011269 [Penicillium hetheringtonii]|uniref:Uncharacterized protein n=1 Tax=Penicillium hetheringtonii TaxID=911720 RepID=A0AAD6D9V5_9EURO|nr:hypothetical protein N7450_011269 [Penicillium hetheringtonii]
MDAYPDDYVNHNLPLVLLSGLEAGSENDNEKLFKYPLLAERGHNIFSDFPPLSGAVAEELRQVLLAEDGSHMPWKAGQNSNGNQPGSRLGYRIKSTGRSHKLPPRKADPPQSPSPTSPTVDSESNVSGSGINYALHSPISPLSPGSPTFPDGLLTPLWVTKHQDLVPAAVLNFFPFSLDPNMNSLRDNQLKIEINGLKKEWEASGFKTRFVAVLISEEGDGGYEGEIDDRVAGIRRATNLDQKSIFVIPPDATTSELKDFVSSLFSLLQPTVVEYYRDLSKHARRKRNRSSIPPPTAPPTSGTSQTLSLQGWNVRYEFKLGILAEFRQEMDAACRNYESAYETLFGQEAMHSLFASFAVYSGQVKLPLPHAFGPIIRIRTKDIVNRRGKGSKNYGWEAWEARWSMVMAQLIHRAGSSLQVLETALDPAQALSIFCPPKKSIRNPDRVSPWEQLHHEGYWLYRSAKHTMLRRKLAEQIPNDDRLSPGQSPASQIASKSYLYDTYLAPDTHQEFPHAEGGGFDHSGLILDTLKMALEEFTKRHQTRKPHWATLTWRRSGWWQLMETYAWALRECALNIEDQEMVLKIDWELLNKAFPSRPAWQYDIHKSLEMFPTEKPKPSVVLRAEDVLTSLTASLVFEKSEGNVGEPLKAQLTISSCAQPASAPIRLSEVKLVFEGCLRPVKLQADHDENSNTSSPCCISSISLREPSSPDNSSLQSPTSGLATLIGIADLTIGPSQTKVYNLICIPREAGDAQVACIAMHIDEEKFDLAYMITGHSERPSSWWQQTKKGASQRRIGKDRDTGRCKIMPKPPKIRISTPNLRSTYYTNERVTLSIGIHNEEDERAEVLAEVRLFGTPESTAKLAWSEADSSPDSAESGSSTPTEGPSHFIKQSVGFLDRSADKELGIVLADTQEAAKFSLRDLRYFFSVSDDLVGDLISKPGGLVQKWCLNSKVVSFALEPLVIEKMALKLLDISIGAVCNIESEVLISPETPQISPEELRDSNFFLDVQKVLLGDRRPTALNFALEITWRRNSSGSAVEDNTTTSVLEIPRFVVPMGEPRVLASSSPSNKLPGLIHLEYTVENPSTHFLTFNLMMEASEHFAFSGPKTTVIQLVPLSRHTVRYNILAAKRGLWIQPQLVVVDTYFNKTLRVLPTGEMRADKKGVLVWVDADD